MAASQAEFVRLLSQHSSMLFGFILALTTNRADADDVFQNTSVVLWEKFETFQPGSNFLAWASRIAYFEVLYARRKSGRVQTLSEEAWHALADHALAISDEPTHEQQALADCMEKLSSGDRELLHRKYFLKESVAEMAESLSKSVHSIYRSLSRAHDQLARCVRRELSA